jgi:hypothetical protein
MKRSSLQVERRVCRRGARGLAVAEALEATAAPFESLREQ